MNPAHQNVINRLYGVYKSKGFITVDSVLDALTETDTELSEVEWICDHLLTIGVIIRDEQTGAEPQNEDEEVYDRSQTDYDQLYADIIANHEDLSGFIEQVRHIQAPQHREWQTLVPQAKAGNIFAYHRIVEMYLRTVVKLAVYTHQKFGLSLADTIQEGTIGLITALAKYDPGRSEGFLTYFPWWVRQRIDREIPFPINQTVYYPVHVRGKLFRIWEVVTGHRCESCGMNDACPAMVTKISEVLECTEDAALAYLRCFEEFLSVERLVDYESPLLSDNGSLMDDLLEHHNRVELRTAIEDALATLKPREQDVLRLRFGFDGTECTLEQVGNLFGVTRERIRQIEAKAIKKLQHKTRISRLRPFWDNTGA